MGGKTTATILIERNTEALREFFKGYVSDIFGMYENAERVEDRLLLKMQVVEELTSMGLAIEASVHSFVVYIRRNNRCQWRAVIHADTLQKARDLKAQDEALRPSWQHQIVAIGKYKAYPMTLPSNHKWLCPFLGLEDVVT